MLCEIARLDATQAEKLTKQHARLGKNENVNTELLVKICEALGCNVDRIMDVIEQKEDTV